MPELGDPGGEPAAEASSAREAVGPEVGGLVQAASAVARVADEQRFLGPRVEDLERQLDRGQTRTRQVLCVVLFGLANVEKREPPRCPQR